jgi:GR25 family glycosyltransferase involved in LPS biosynthesis
LNFNDVFPNVVVLSRYESKDRQVVFEKNMQHTGIKYKWHFHGGTPFYNNLANTLYEMIINDPKKYIQLNPKTTIASHLKFLINNKNDRETDEYINARRWVQNFVRPGYLATTAAHIEAIQRAKSDGLQNLVIMEDDSIALKNFADIIPEYLESIPENWDFLSFGGVVNSWYINKKRRTSRWAGKIDRIPERWVELSTIFCLPCYAINHTMYDYILDFYKNNYEIIDAFYNCIVSDDNYLETNNFNCLITNSNLFISNPFIRHSSNELSEFGKKLVELSENNTMSEEEKIKTSSDTLKQIWGLNQIHSYDNYINILNEKSIINTQI